MTDTREREREEQAEHRGTGSSQYLLLRQPDRLVLFLGAVSCLFRRESGSAWQGHHNAQP